MIRTRRHLLAVALLAAGVFLAGSSSALALIPGTTGTTFNLTAKPSYLSSPDGTQLHFWGLALSPSPLVQYPGPTLIVNQGATITINLTNLLPEPVSLMFPGLEGPTVPVYADVDFDGTDELRSLTHEAGALGGTAVYTFTASEPGTYYYQSATNIHKQLPLGLFGVIIVRSATANRAYNNADSQYTREYLILLSEMDDLQNIAVDTGQSYDATSWNPDYWFINGRNSPDTMSDDYVPWLPYQPYGAMVRMHPGENILLRVVNLGRDPHPFHTHGNHVKVLAREGRLLKTSAGATVDLAEQHFSVNIQPGQTWDGLFKWSADQLGWDIYGHAAADPMQPGEFAPDHGKALPTQIPFFTSLAYGEWYGGSPYLGQSGELPPDNPRLNDSNAFVFMWHSHRENEMTNKNEFPGGMMTMLMIDAPSVPIP